MIDYFPTQNLYFLARSVSTPFIMLVKFNWIKLTCINFLLAWNRVAKGWFFPYHCYESCNTWGGVLLYVKCFFKFSLLFLNCKIGLLYYEWTAKNFHFIFSIYLFILMIHCRKSHSKILCQVFRSLCLRLVLHLLFFVDRQTYC